MGVIIDTIWIQTSFKVRPEQVTTYKGLLGKVGAQNFPDQTAWIGRQGQMYNGSPRYVFVGEHGTGEMNQALLLYQAALALGLNQNLSGGAIMFDTIFVLGATLVDFLPVVGFVVDMQPPS